MSEITINEAIDELEAYANGELDTGEIPDSLELYNNPRQTKLVRTPNGSVILVMTLKELSDERFADLLGFEGKVISSPQCPHLTGEKVDFVVDYTGAIGFFIEERLRSAPSVESRFAGS